MIRLASLLLLSWAGTAWAQAPSPGEIADMLQLRMYQREQDRQRERVFQQYEHDYDLRKCYQVGRRGPDLEICAQDSAAWRRGIRPDQPAAPGYGLPIEDEPTCIEQGHGLDCTRD